MTSTYDANDEQAQLWNGPSGQSWVAAQALLDRAFTPFEDRLVEAASTGSHRRVLDIGCGTGSTTLAVARRLGAASRCVGIDISEPMLALARTRGAHEGSPAEFIRADAQTYPFEAGVFDLVVSRFGVMFFDDPVRAFANLRRACADDAKMRCIAWRSAADNPFMTTAERAAAPLLPALPARQPDAPGQFACANRTRVHGILAESGWSGIDIQPIDVECAFPARELTSYFTRLGPVARVLQEVDDETRARVIDVVRPAFDAYVRGDEIRFTAACWMVGASAGVRRNATD